MNKEFITDFIEVYRQHPSLWQIKSTDYVNKNLKTIAYKSLIQICEKYQITADVNVVTKKIQSLRGAFRKECNKIEKSITIGKGLSLTYKVSDYIFLLLVTNSFAILFVSFSFLTSYLSLLYHRLRQIVYD